MATADGAFETLVGATESYAANEIGGAVRTLRRSLRAGARGVRQGARVAVRTHPLALAVRGTKQVGRGLARATGALRRRIFNAFFGKLAARRARWIAWNRRRSMSPTTDERTAARRWAVSYVRRKGILGRFVGATLAGEPVTSAALTASIPVLLELARRALRTAESEGAPPDPRDAGDE